jgi:hypothetical protein
MFVHSFACQLLTTVHFPLIIQMMTDDKDKDFICKNYKYKKYQCFACGKLGSSDLSSRVEVCITLM